MEVGEMEEEGWREKEERDMIGMVVDIRKR